MMEVIDRIDKNLVGAFTGRTSPQVMSNKMHFLVGPLLQFYEQELNGDFPSSTNQRLGRAMLAAIVNQIELKLLTCWL